MVTPDPAPAAARVPALDAGRGAALVAMILFHAVWDMAFLGLIPASFTAATPFRAVGWTIAASFLTLAGISLALAHGAGLRRRAFLRRLALIVAGAAAISLATYVALPGAWVFFGILHNIALSSLIALGLLRAPWPVAALAAAVVFAGPAVARLIDWPELNAPWLDWLGLGRFPPRTVDWVPVFPWTGWVLAGLALAKATPSRLLALRGVDAPAALVWMGRRSLAIYLLHQPVLLAILWPLAALTRG